MLRAWFLPRFSETTSKVMLVPLFLSYYAIGDDKDLTIETSKGDVFEAFAPPAWRT